MVSGNFSTGQSIAGGSREALLDLIEDRIGRILENTGAAGPLSSAVSYVMTSPGKRLRPLIALTLLSDLGGDPEEFVQAAVALEIVHSASLVHDDLPSLDNDDYRRGLPTCHKKFGESTAVLAGDYMFPWALMQIQASGYGPEIKNEMFSVLSKAYMDLCAGQQLDLLPGHRRGDMTNIARLKTGALFSACFRFPLAALKHPEESKLLAEEIGILVGICFQIADDFLDEFAVPYEKGRLESSDRKNRKTTFFSNAKSDPMETDPLDTMRKAAGRISECFQKMQTNGGNRGNFRATRELLASVFSRFECMQVLVQIGDPA